MNTLRNKVQLIGNVGNNPVIKETVTGKKMAKFSMATMKTFRDQKGERKTQTQWHNMIAWGNQSNFIERLVKKGCQLAVDGELINRNYIDQNGNKKSITEIAVQRIMLLDRTKKSND